MDGRRAGAALVAALAVAATGCGGGGGGGQAAALGCVRALRSVDYVAPSIGDQLFVHFLDGGIVGLVFAPTHEAARRIAAAAPAPGDPFAYKAVGTAIVSWPGDPDDPHLRPVEHCLLKR